jgi:hypothetical protein
MSVLSLPRIYFTGAMCWDPATGNNNDYFPTYDDEQAALNWGFFNQFGIDITPANFGTTFRPWAIANQTINFPSPQQPTTGIPGEWNYFGGNGAYFTQYADPSTGIDRTTRITGGMINPGQPVTSDPLIGTPVTVLGDPFGDPQPKPPGRLIDNNPTSVYSAQIYFNSMAIGNESANIAAPRADRMQARFVNFKRNFNLAAAGGASVTWQACFPISSGLKINAGKSNLLAQLQAAIGPGKAKGIMVRFNTYLNLYFQNGYFNDFKPRPKSAGELPAAYDAALKSGNLFSNPCYSRVVGVIGPWYDDELNTCPEGRYLAPPPTPVLCNPRAAQACWQNQSLERPMMRKSAHQASEQVSAGISGPINVPAASLKTYGQLGVAVAEFHDQSNVLSNVLSIDLLNTFPEWFWQGEKVDFKDIDIGVVSPNNSYTKIATLASASYAQANYESAGGIVDLPINSQQASLLKDGQIVFLAQPGVWVATVDSQGKLQQSKTQVILAETPLTAQTDSRGIYLNESESSSFQISVKHRGKPAAGASVLIVKYNPPDATSNNVNAVPVGGPQVVNITNGRPLVVTVTPDFEQPIQTNAAVFQADANGMVNVDIQAAGPGFPVLVFYPYLSGSPVPQATGSFDEVGTAMFTTIRVLSYDDAFVEQFVQLWNSVDDPASRYDPAKAWNFVYSNILYLYDMIFPVMLRYVPLGDRTRVEAAIDQVLTLISPKYFPESTIAMPITRDLSRGKRTVLELWGGLVKRGYPPQPITAPAPATV